MLKRFSVDLGYNPVDMVVRCALTGKMLNDIESVPKNVADYNKIAVVCNYLLKGSNETVARIVGLEEMKKIPSYVCRPIANYLAVAFTPSNPVLHALNRKSGHSDFIWKLQ